MTAASEEAYAAIVDHLPKKRAAVFGAIQFKPQGKTIREVCEDLAWPHTTVSARIFELAEAGLIKGVASRGGQTVWIETGPDEVERLRTARKAAKKFEADVKSWETIDQSKAPWGSAHYAEPCVRVSIEMPCSIFNKLRAKGPVRVRFL